MNPTTLRRLTALLALSVVAALIFVPVVSAADDDGGGNDDAAYGNNNGNYNYDNYEDWYYQYYYGDAADDDAAGDDDDAAAAGDDDAAVADDYYAADDDAVADEGGAYDNDGYQMNADDDYIQYWTDYAILPKRCIVYNDVDVIVFSVFDNHYNQCGDTPIGTYYTPVPYYIQGHLDQKEQDMYDQGYDYELPDVAQYAYCTPYEIQGVQYYFQIGCADGTSQALAINIYEDNTCTKRSVVDGYDDSNIDVSDIHPTFKKCNACVNWFDRNDDQVDDGFYENRMMNAPLCSTAWSYKETCGRKCQHTGLEKVEGGWAVSDLVLLSILVAFGLIMVGLIVNKRNKMSNKETLLEQAAISSVGLQLPHIIGICVLVILVITVFALLGLKNITWALLLITNTALFAYLMKLTIASSVRAGETIIGPDGEIVRQDSDESSVEEETSPGKSGTYALPTIS